MDGPQLDSRIGRVVYLAANPFSLVGIVLTTTAGVASFFTLHTHFGKAESNPYLGLLALCVLPPAFLAGIALILAGYRRSKRRKLEKGTYPSFFPAPNWRNPRFRRLVIVAALAVGINLILGGRLTYSTVEYMDTVTFCGQTCHVMEPQFVSFQVATHARLSCVDCHIGEGFDSYLAAKLNGAKQLAEMLTGTYPRPIPTPVPSLAQGKITCEGCHANLDFGSKIREWIRFAEDETSSATRTDLFLHIGGGSNTRGAHGAHPEGSLEYRSTPDRQTIPWIRYEARDGRVTEYAVADWDPAEAASFELRQMDCVDCHNRAAHSFESVEQALHESLAASRIDPSLPWIKREALRLLSADYASHEEAAQKAPEALRAFYQANYPEAAATQAAAILDAGEELVRIYSRNVFPEMKVGWGTYPNLNGHENDEGGCFRCHNDELVSLDSARRPIGDRCEGCHEMRVVDQPISAPSVSLLIETRAEREAIPREMYFETRAGRVGFDHAEHERLSEGECAACHSRLFPMSREPLDYAANIHRTAEANRTSCAGCHFPGGEAFGTEDCRRCHTNLSNPRLPPSQSQPISPLPSAVFYETSLGQAVFDHSKHVEHSGGDCTSCHNRLFPMSKAPLGYGEDWHRSAEAAETSCAGCHVKGGKAFASTGNCGKCHPGLSETEPTPVTGNRGLPGAFSYQTRLGEARFGHDKHVELANGDCTACHTKIFALEPGLANYADDLHRTSEATKTSCGACHVAGGEAFESKENCTKCHVDLTASARGSSMGLPAAAVYPNRLGDVSFDHDLHIEEAGGGCASCHDSLFPMTPAVLEAYSDDYHRTAERDKTSCARCHSEGGESFGSIGNCNRCHQGLELVPQPSRARNASDGLKRSRLQRMPGPVTRVPGSRRARRAATRFPFGFLLFQLPRLVGKEGKYVGSKRCAVCHQEEASEPHDRHNEMEATETYCESCHGPGLEHVLHLDPAELIDFREGQSHLINQTCLDCHAGDRTTATAFAGDHARSGVACTGCHQVHGRPEPGLLQAQSNALCSSCHPSERAAFSRPFRHKLDEGSIDCVDCHDAHGEQARGFASRALGNETSCLNCHADKRGPFPFEHAPVKMEPCTSCHEAHGSANPRMLTRHDSGRLCIECHSMTDGSFGGAATGFHDLRSARFQSCTSCHTKIHGSFVSRDFLR